MSEHPSPAGPPRGRSSKAPLGVVVVDPLHVVQAGLSALIATQPDMRVLARAGDATAAIHELGRIRKRAPGVVLVGIELEGERDAFWLIHEVRERWPNLSVVACGYRAPRMGISRALFVGADGYIDHRLEPHEFLAAIRRAGRGEFVLEGVPSDWLGPIADGVERQLEAEGSLTSREIEVLSVAAEGLTARQIAHKLGVRERTVTTHLGNIYSKLGAGGRVEAVTTAARSGLLALR